MDNPAPNATTTSSPEESPSIAVTEDTSTPSKPEYTAKDMKHFKIISWLSVVLLFLPITIVVVVSDGYKTLQGFSILESIIFPIVMFAVAFIGCFYAKKSRTSVTKALNALFGTFYVFLMMLYFASGVIGFDAVLIIPLLLPVVLPLFFIFLMGTKITLSKKKDFPLDEEGNPINPNTLDPLVETLPDKTFAELVFQILGVFTSILLGYYITTGILQLL